MITSDRLVINYMILCDQQVINSDAVHDHHAATPMIPSTFLPVSWSHHSDTIT